ncbi:MAG: M15 family metallopeptidase, partial [Bacilli bacterium]|nr:M15 family metallopeptidase [Bacilli bacterium]
EITNYTDITTLINKYNILPKDATFNDLVSVPKEYSIGTNKVRAVVLDPLKQMIKDAKKDGAKLSVLSSFRTWNTQTTLFKNNKKKNGEAHALMYSAKPGHSEHQLGLAIDFNKASMKFEGTKECEWLKQNAYKYGFIMRYPKGKEYITGFAYEPWHYRYLGVEIATKVYEENITYEEYLVKYKK